MTQFMLIRHPMRTNIQSATHCNLEGFQVLPDIACVIEACIEPTKFAEKEINRYAVRVYHCLHWNSVKSFPIKVGS